jgi:hypothetical protein
MVRFGLRSRTVHGAALWLVGLGLACGDDSTPGATTFSSTTGSSDSTSTTTSTTTGGTSELDDTGTSDEGSSDDEVGPVCPQTHECVPAAPEGWEGPVALLQSLVDDDEPECGEGYSEVATVGYQGLVAAPAECGCSCGDAEGVSCALSVIARFWGDDPTCSENVPAQYEFFTTVCNGLPAALAANTYWTVHPGQVTGGSCEPIPTMEIDPARFEKRVTACATSDLLDGCSPSETCAPRAQAPFMDRLCVWQSGESDCPEGYADGHTLFSDIVDERGCADCTCGEPVGLCDTGSLTLLSQPCNPPVAGVLTPNGHCQSSSNQQAVSAIYNPGAPSSFCAASESSAVGTAAHEGPVTVCCR